jgi:hypothetical protein
MTPKVLSNNVIETFGGVRWQSVPDALKLIQTATGCGEDEAFEALKTWISDNRVSSRGGYPLGGLGVGLRGALVIANSLQPDTAPARTFALSLVEVDMIELRQLLEFSDSLVMRERRGVERRKWAQEPVEATLRELYPDGRVRPGRKVMLDQVQRKLGKSISASTLDRARNAVWGN